MSCCGLAEKKYTRVPAPACFTFVSRDTLRLLHSIDASIGCRTTFTEREMSTGKSTAGEINYALNVCWRKVCVRFATTVTRAQWLTDSHAESHFIIFGLHKQRSILYHANPFRKILSNRDYSAANVRKSHKLHREVSAQQRGTKSVRRKQFAHQRPSK